MASATKLTKNDVAVLGALFDPEASLTGTTQISSTVAAGRYDLSTTHQIQQAEREALLDLNTENPPASNIRATIARLDKLIDRYPDYASAYNNRAQARRTLFDIEDSAEDTTAMDLIFSDLGRAIELASPASPTAAVSPEQAKVLASAYTHRAYLLYKSSRSDVFKQSLDHIEGISKLDKNTLEEMASKDFAAGGRFGNKIAKQLAVQTNPYAKLCGSIVKEALRKEMESYVAGSGPVV